MDEIRKLLKHEGLSDDMKDLLKLAYKAGINDMMTELKKNAVKVSTTKAIGLPAHTYMRAVGTNKIEMVGQQLSKTV